ncbi:hypothetical protein ACFRJ9_18700 [Paenarthrobacter sp. NPDC056912]|uniref:hypothetical protein n=1 Tax=Paenarthrobacter sp. NPDC056912 TaxID=3345965 RepID=UPI00366D932E
MKPLEQQISDAAPPFAAAVLPADAAPGIDPVDVVTVGPGLPTIRPRRNGVPRKLMHAVLAFSLLAASGWVLSAALTRPPEQGNGVDSGHPADVGPAAVASAAASATEWRTATLLSPWADASAGVEASIDLPATWSVHRHEPSAEYPGLHVTVADQDSLPVATLYFGPAPHNDSCALQQGPDVHLQQAVVATGAELLDPALASAFSYGLTPAPQLRGSFGLVARTSAGQGCGTTARVDGSPPVILRFGDELGLVGPAPRSSYARTFASADDAGRYIRSQEFGTLKRLISSLRFSFPEDRSQLWQLPDPRRPVG